MTRVVVIWYTYFDFSALDNIQFNLLISKKDSSVGNGYLSVYQ